jgi:hypothetical protein
MAPADDLAQDAEALEFLFGRGEAEAIIPYSYLKPSEVEGERGNVVPLFPARRKHLARDAGALRAFKSTQYVAGVSLRPDAAVGRSATLEEFDGAPAFYARKKSKVWEFCTLAVDLDAYKLPDPLTAGEVIGNVIDMCRDGDLPDPTVIAETGRGVGLYYLLFDDNPDPGDYIIPIGCPVPFPPPKLTEQNRQKRQHIMRSLHHLLGHLNPDPAMLQDIQPFKAPGTFNYEVGMRVTFRVNYVPRFNPATGEMGFALPSYTLDGLMDALDLTGAQPVKFGYRLRGKARERSAVVPAFNPSARLYFTAQPKPQPVRRVSVNQGTYRARRLIFEIEAINKHRSGLRANTCREKMLWHYARAQFNLNMALLRKEIGDREERARVALARAADATRALNMTFRAPLRPREVDKALKFNSSVVPPVGHSIAADLEVTEREAKALNLSSILPARLWQEREDRRQAVIAAREERRLQRAEKQQRARLLRERGMTFRAIAADVAVDARTVRRWLAENEAQGLPDSGVTQNNMHHPATYPDTVN